MVDTKMKKCYNSTMKNKMKTYISFPRNSYNFEEEGVFQSALNFFAKTIMSTRMANTLKLKLHIRKSLHKELNGQVVSKLVGSKTQKEFLIQLNHSRDLSTKLETIAHEMIHVKQLAKKELQYFKKGNNVHVRWKGQDFGPESKIDYWTCPWEVEARQYQKQYLQEFLLNGK